MTVVALLDMSAETGPTIPRSHAEMAVDPVVFEVAKSDPLKASFAASPTVVYSLRAL